MYVVCENRYAGGNMSWCAPICAGEDLDRCKTKMKENREELLRLFSYPPDTDKTELDSDDAADLEIELSFRNGETFRITCVKTESV